MTVKNLLKQAPFTMRHLAEEAGVSYAALRGWAMGRRLPDPDSRARVSAALRRHAARLAQLADQLDASARE